MYLFYTKRNDKSARVDAIYQDHEVAAADQAKGFYLEGALPEVPQEEGKEAVLYVDPTSGAVWYELEGREQNNEVADLQRRLFEAENQLKNADARYKDMDKENASLAEVRQAKAAQLKYLSEREIAAGFRSPSLGHLFGFEEVDQSNMTKQALLFLSNPNATSCSWKTLDAGVVTLTKEQFMALLPEGEAHTRRNVERQWQLTQDALAATSKDAVDLINW